MSTCSSGTSRRWTNSPRSQCDGLGDVAPVWDADWEQYYSSYSIGGLAVGFGTVETPVSAVIPIGECMGDSPWDHFDRVNIEGHSIAVVASELRLLSELVRGRPDRWRPIAAHLARHGYDEDLMARCSPLGPRPPPQRGSRADRGARLTSVPPRSPPVPRPMAGYPLCAVGGQGKRCLTGTSPRAPRRRR